MNYKKAQLCLFPFDGDFKSIISVLLPRHAGNKVIIHTEKGSVRIKVEGIEKEIIILFFTLSDYAKLLKEHKERAFVFPMFVKDVETQLENGGQNVWVIANGYLLQFMKKLLQQKVPSIYMHQGTAEDIVYLLTPTEKRA